MTANPNTLYITAGNSFNNPALSVSLQKCVSNGNIFPNSVAAAAYSAANVTGMIDTKIVPDDVEIQKCHLHNKPQLNCKFCRKYKSAVHHQARLAMAHEAQNPVEERRNMVEMSNTTSYNINNLLRENILSSEYFKSLYSLKSFNELVDEIYQYADHAEPYCCIASRAPSTLFCCLYKLLNMKLNYKQVKTLLEHVDSPYIRCAGFLYLRYVHPADKLWHWFEPYFLDDEEFYPSSDKHHLETIGKYIESLLSEDKYFTTVLPRLPVKIKNQYGAQLLALGEHRNRKESNKQRLREFLPGTKVLACSNGDWLEGQVVIVDDSIFGRTSALIKLEDDNEELIDLGLITLIEKNEGEEKKKDKKKHNDCNNNRDHADSFSRDNDHDRRKKTKKSKKTSRGSPSRSPNNRKSRHKRSRSFSRDDSDRGRDKNRHKDRHTHKSKHSQKKSDKHSDSSARGNSVSDCAQKNPKSQEDLMLEFRRRERDKALATGKDYARRPTSYKSALSFRNPINGRRRSRSRSPSRVKTSTHREFSTREKERVIQKAEDTKKNEPSFEHRQKMAQLMERYTKSTSDGAQRQRDVEGPHCGRLG